jgi:hypothetical protein
MKKIIFTLFLTTFSLLAFAQDTSSLFKQAQLLLNARRNTSDTIAINPDIAKALSNVYHGGAVALSAELNKNPFLKGKFVFVATHGTMAKTTLALGSLGDLDVTNFANAIASLMIDRAKQELTLAFFNHLQEFSKKYPEFQTLFPKTYDKMRNLLTYTYPQMLPALRASFFEDLQQIGYNLEAVLELPRFKPLMDRFPEIRMAAATLKLIHDLEKGKTADKVLAEVDNYATQIENDTTLMKNASPPFKNLLATVHFSRIFSESLRSTTGKTIWITAAEAKGLISDELECRLYLGLLWEKLNSRKPALTYYLDSKHPEKADTLKNLLGANAGNILLFQTKLSQFIDQGAKVQAAWDTIYAKGPGVKPNKDEYYNFINTSLDAIDYAFSLVKIIDPRLQADDYLAIARKSNTLYKDIYSKQYTQAVSDGLDVISSVEKLTRYSKKKNQTIGDKTKAYQQASDTLFTFIDKVRPYALFIANVVEAKNENDIKSALDNAILPAGSSSIKKNTAGNLSLQTFLGAYFTTRNYSPNAVRAWSDKFGVYGPIGLSYTAGFTSWGKGGSLSLFGSVFDLGAIIDYKLKQDPNTVTSNTSGAATTATKQYSVNLGQIFSPGVHVVYGFFGNLPLSLGFGAQYGPGLSKIDGTGAASVINPSWRFNLFLGVDLPFFNLINRSKSGK